MKSVKAFSSVTWPAVLTQSAVLTHSVVLTQSAILWRKILSLTLSLWVIFTLSFVCLFRLPGDPARIILGPQASTAAIAKFRRDAGFDRPAWEQYIGYLRRLSRLDLGTSFALRRPVASLLVERGQMTARLAGVAAGFILCASLLLPIGLRLINHQSWIGPFEVVLRATALAPPYVLGTGVLLLAAGQLGWITVVFDPSHFLGWLLAGATLAAYPVAVVLRIFAGRLEEENQSMYALRARALGLPQTYIVLKEILPNALPSALAGLTNSLAYFFTGAFFVEVIFGIPGLGRLAQEALRNKDMALLSGICLLFAIVILILSNLLDFLHGYLDPRSSHSGN